MEDQIRNRIKELVAQRDQILGQINQNTTQSQQLEVAFHSRRRAPSLGSTSSHRTPRARTMAK